MSVGCQPKSEVELLFDNREDCGDIAYHKLEALPPDAHTVLTASEQSFENVGIDILNLVRISKFGFRIWATRPSAPR